MARTGHGGMDQDNQPLNIRFGAHHRLERDISELLGLAKGMLADAVVVPAEIEYLAQWIESHPDAASNWPCDVISHRLSRIMADGVITEAERSDLSELLTELIGGQLSVVVAGDVASKLPLDQPPPRMEFEGRSFVLTGKFAMGTRDACEEITSAEGGICGGNVNKRTNYLVIGTFASRDWIHTSYGRKIEKAVELRRGGSPIHIVGEDHWANALEAR